jgi:hypothetical protein
MLLFLGLAWASAFTWEEMTADREVVVAARKKVLYTRSVNEADARRLGKALQDMGVFTGTTEQAARLDREGLGWVVSFWIKGPISADDRAYWAGLARELSQKVFGGRRVRVRLFDVDSDAVKATLDSSAP